MFLGCDLPIQLMLKSLSSAYNDRLVDHIFIYVTNYELCNILGHLLLIICFTSTARIAILHLQI